jgi:uncharacterized protein YdbL (DUF1318 family)
MRLKILTVLLVLLSLPAMAMDLQGARSQGLVGERLDGYVQAIDASAQGLVDEVNAKRKAEYARISKENGQPVAVVAKIAAEQIIANLPAGAKYQDSSGNWKTR